MNSYSTCVTQIKKKRADTEEFLISPYLTLNTKPDLKLSKQFIAQYLLKDRSYEEVYSTLLFL